MKTDAIQSGIWGLHTTSQVHPVSSVQGLVSKTSMDRGPTLSLSITKGVANSEVVGPAEEGLTQAVESIDESDGGP